MPLKSFPPVVPLDVGTENGGVICSALGTAKQAPTFIKHLLYAQKGPLHHPQRQGPSSPLHRCKAEGQALGRCHLPPHREGLGFLLGPL